MKTSDIYLYDLYLYNSDTGEFVKIVKNQPKSKAAVYAKDGFSVKVVDPFDGVVVDTLDAFQ